MFLLAAAGLVLPASSWPVQQVDQLSGTVDNDYFNFWTPADQRPDHDYTHGMRLTVGFSKGLLLTGLLAPGRAACVRGQPTACARSELAIGQEIYVPRRDAVNPIPGERPYAGWLYVRLRERLIDAKQAHEVGVTLGVTGKPSLAEAVQETFHDIAGFRTLLGWDNQLPFEPGIIVSYGYRRLLASARAGNNTVIVLDPDLGVGLGNVRTDLHGGARLAVGWNVPHPWARSGNERPAVSAYGTFRLRGQLVVRDLFLDGSTFAESVSVDKRLFVPEYRIGFSLRIGDLRLEYGATTRGREYKTQPRSHTFGSIVVEMMRTW